MRAKEIFLLIFIILIGAFISMIYNGEFEFGWGEGWIFGYDEFIFEETETLSPPFPSYLDIRNPYGSVEVLGSEDDTITISFEKRIWRRDEKDAQEVADMLKMNMDTTGEALLLSTNRHEFKRKNFETNFFISVPDGMDVDVSSSYGRVRIERTGETNINNRHGEVLAFDIRGELFLANSYEDVEVQHVQSDCFIEGSYSSVTVNDVKGAVEIKNSNGSVILEDISQDVTVRAPHSKIYAWDISGTLDIENSYEKIELNGVGAVKIVGNQSPVEIDGAIGFIDIDNRYGKIRLKNTQGSVLIEGKNLGVTGSHVVGESITISSSYEDIELDNFSGKTSISLAHGDVQLSPSQLGEPLEVIGSHVDIRFYWPANGRYPIEAKAIQGEIQWKLDAEISYQKDNGESVIQAFLVEGQKPTIFLSTSYGTIWIEEAIVF